MSCRKVQKSEGRVRKLLKRKDGSEKRDWRKRVPTPPPGLLHDYQNKGLAWEAVCKNMKTKELGKVE
jgi:hypothetical protein